MNSNHFIPQIKTIKGVRTSSTPFVSNNGKPILLSDVIEVRIEEENIIECFLIELK